MCAYKCDSSFIYNSNTIFSLSLFLTLEIIFSCQFSPHTLIPYSIHGYSSKERQMKCSWQISHNGCPTPTYGCKIIYSISFRDLKCNDSLFCVTTFFSNEGYRYRCHLLHTATHKWFQIQMNAVKNQINKIYIFFRCLWKMYTRQVETRQTRNEIISIK